MTPEHCAGSMCRDTIDGNCVCQCEGCLEACRHINEFYTPGVASTAIHCLDCGKYLRKVTKEMVQKGGSR